MNSLVKNTIPKIQSYARKIKASHAFIGDKICFLRKEQLVEGVVIDYRENSVLVEISSHDARLLDIATNLTIVNHKNYQKTGSF